MSRTVFVATVISTSMHFSLDMSRSGLSDFGHSETPFSLTEPTQVRVQLSVCACGIRRPVPLLLEYAQKPGFREHALSHVPLEHGTGWFPIRTQRLLGRLEQRGRASEVSTLPGDIPAEIPCIGGARICLANAGED